jgi:hypothetical protein
MKKKRLLTNKMLDFETGEPGFMGMTIPDHTQQALTLYLVNGYEPGGFLTAMLAMDMPRAIACADTANRQMMWAIGRWITTECPEVAWGNYDKVTAWVRDTHGFRSEYRTAYEKEQVWLTLVK